jgi:hypothetical protein
MMWRCQYGARNHKNAKLWFATSWHDAAIGSAFASGFVACSRALPRVSRAFRGWAG